MKTERAEPLLYCIVFSTHTAFSLFRTGLRGIFDARLNAMVNDGLVSSDNSDSSTSISHSELISPPRFVRFKWAALNYSIGFQPIARKCKLLVKYLRTLSPTLIDGETKIYFAACINRDDPFQFKDHSALIKHLRCKLLPICGSLHMHGISFQISLKSSDYNGFAITNFITSILELTIEQCDFVALQLEIIPFLLEKISLPVEVILNWLNRMPDNGMTRLKRKRERYLLINGILIENAREMCERFKTVRLFHF